MAVKALSVELAAAGSVDGSLANVVLPTHILVRVHFIGSTPN